MSLADDEIRPFLEQKPLYTKAVVTLPQYAMSLYPNVLELECEHCGRTRPFREPATAQSGSGRGPEPLSSGVARFVYQCTGCTDTIWRCWVEVNRTEGWIRKVGQLPPWSIAIPADLKRHLGRAAEHYKRALICLSQSYGLGACAYMRRVLEDTIDPLLKLELEVRRAEGADAKEVEEISAAIQGKVFDVKTEIAYRHAPRAMIVDGNNPLKLIHDKLSIGVHQLDEDQCVEIAALLSAALEYVVTAMNRQREEKAAFTAAIRQAAAGSLES